MNNEIKHENGIGIALLICFLISIIINVVSFNIAIGSGDMLSGMYFLFGFLLSIIPFGASIILSIINVCFYFSKNSSFKCNNFFLLFIFLLYCL